MIRIQTVFYLLVGGSVVMGQVPATQSSSSPQAQASVSLARYRDAAVKRWESSIKALEAKNAEEVHPESSVLFIGSSSIRRWSSIGEDVAPYHPVQRGYGGAKYSDVAVYAQRLIHPHKYRALVIFVGNDIQGKPTDHTVDEVESLVRHTLTVSRQHQPQAPILLIEVTPTSSRFAAWSNIRQLNARLRDIALTMPHVYFVPTAGHYLHPATATPRDELFVDDKLHLNRDGYRIWGQIIRRRLDEVFQLEALVASQQ